MDGITRALQRRLIMWLARDKDGSLWLHLRKPTLNGGVWSIKNNVCIESLNIEDSSLPEVTFENSPQKVYLKLKEDTKITYIREALINLYECMQESNREEHFKQRDTLGKLIGEL